MNIYYFGLKERTIKNTNFFKKSALISGEPNENVIYYKDIYNKDIDYNKLENFKKISKFYIKCLKIFFKSDKQTKCMMYNQAGAKYFLRKNRLLCINNLKFIDKLNNKPLSRSLLKNEACLLDYKYIKGKDISFKSLQKQFDETCERFVVQQPVGFGGVGTYVLDKQNENKIRPQLNKNVVYSVSMYVENAISINNTFIISKNHTLIFDGSCQIINITTQLSYDGWNFSAYKKLGKKVKDNIKAQTQKITKKLQALGYRGIGGIDYIVKGTEVFFMEINPRFQASSEELDKILVQNKLPSIFELNYLSFYNEKKFIMISKEIEGIKYD